MKKISFFCGSLENGGAERVISILSKQFLEYADEVEIILYYDRPIYYELDSRVTVTCINHGGSRNMLSSVGYLRKHIKETKPDVLISFLAPMNMFVLGALVGVKQKIIVADRNNPEKVPTKSYLRFIRNHLYKRADFIVAQTSHNADYFSKRGLKQTRVIYNPLQMDTYSNMGNSTIKKRKEIISVGRVIPQKNQKLLLDAFFIFHKEHPEYHLTIYGSGSLEQELLDYGKELEIHDCFTITQNNTNLFEEEAKAEIFVMTSKYEGMPNAMIEAMCVGLPIISTSIEGVKEFVQSGVNGYLTSENPKELADRMKELAENKELRRKMGEEASRIYEILTVDKIAKQWMDLL